MAVDSQEQSDDLLNNYEKLRTVGKGAYGVAVLYRKLSEDKLVVIKEINMIDLSASERQMALNEVQVLRILNHPNIISYYRSFERDGMLLIEMEYADGGTLAQFLSRQTHLLKELDILYMFQQIVSAIDYMHSYNILHRDLKTANVFITKENLIKVGDFGISKVMTTLAQAKSVLGTPYYISPEMCQGKEYNQKSDIWTLGCLLYEMACLQKAFEGSNLPALVNKIMKGNLEPVPLQYSEGLRQLIQELLQRDPQCRPTAGEILHRKLPEIVKNLTNGEIYPYQDSALSSQYSFSKRERSGRSVLYEISFIDSSTTLTPVQLPPMFKIKEIAVSNTHFIALTSEFMVYSWGEGESGALGHGDTTAWKGSPQPVEALRDKNIKRIAAGDGFSVFVSESGMLMTCGNGSHGCLGHGDWTAISRPKLVEKLLSVDVTAINCGCQHVAALDIEGLLYTWGRGQGGRLGSGDEFDSCLPGTILLPEKTNLRCVRCGPDATMAISIRGEVFACGNNAYNKLGLSKKRHFLSSRLKEVEKSLLLRKVSSIREDIADVSLGADHTLLLTKGGNVITLGKNNEGQLGRNGTQPDPEPEVMESIADQEVIMLKSASTFSLAATAENELYIWGTRYITPRIMCSETWIYRANDRNGSGGFLKTPFLNLKQKELILTPKGILALYASQQQIDKGETLELAGIYVSRDSIFVLVDTTVPLVRKHPTVKSREVLVEESGNTEDRDSIGPIPNWIKTEVKKSDASWSRMHKV